MQVIVDVFERQPFLPGCLIGDRISDGRGKVCPRLNVGQKPIDQIADRMLQNIVTRLNTIMFKRVDGVRYTLIIIDAVRPVLLLGALDVPSNCTRALCPLRKLMMVAQLERPHVPARLSHC